MTKTILITGASAGIVRAASLANQPALYLHKIKVTVDGFVTKIIGRIAIRTHSQPRFCGTRIGSATFV